MKFTVFFLVVCVAMAIGAPQRLLFNSYYGAGYVGVAPGYLAGAPGTVVAGPTVVNNPWGGQYISPGVVAPYY